jgi:hypothetical protein
MKKNNIVKEVQEWSREDLMYWCTTANRIKMRVRIRKKRYESRRVTSYGMRQ